MQGETMKLYLFHSAKKYCLKARGTEVTGYRVTKACTSHRVPTTTYREQGRCHMLQHDESRQMTATRGET